MSNKYLEKIAFLNSLSPDAKKELAQTGTVAAAGSLGTHLTTMAGQRLGLVDKGLSGRSKLGLTALGGAIGTALDYGAVKLNRAIEKNKQIGKL